jgi:hypothetical protein
VDEATDKVVEVLAGQPFDSRIAGVHQRRLPHQKADDLNYASALRQDVVRFCEVLRVEQQKMREKKHDRTCSAGFGLRWTCAAKLARVGER